MVKPNEDYYGWMVETAEQLRQKQVEELDVETLIEEFEVLAKSQQRELKSRLRQILIHLLKYRYQPEYQTVSWKRTLRVQRRDLWDLLEESPSLKQKVPETIRGVYLSAVKDASDETGLPPLHFPEMFEQTGWTGEQVLDLDFYPGALS